MKTHYLLWSHHEDSVNVVGLSVGGSNFFKETTCTKTQGIRISVLGEGIAAFMLPRAPLPTSRAEYDSSMIYEPPIEVNGISLSGTGDLFESNINGVIIGGMAHVTNKSNGYSMTLMYNFAVRHQGVQVATAINMAYVIRGIQMSIIGNEAEELRGLQLGIRNRSKNTKGIQVGLWNINEKRKLPLINWSFRSKEA